MLHFDMLPRVVFPWTPTLLRNFGLSDHGWPEIAVFFPVMFVFVEQRTFNFSCSLLLYTIASS